MSDTTTSGEAGAPLPDELTITFRNPVDFGGNSYAQMHLREPTADEIIQADELTGRKSDARLVALVSGIPEGAVRKIGARDFLKGVSFLGGFFG